MVDGDSWEELKGGGNQVEVIPYPADAGIRVKTLDDRVLVSLHFHPSKTLESRLGLDNFSPELLLIKEEVF